MEQTIPPVVTVLPDASATFLPRWRSRRNRLLNEAVGGKGAGHH